MSFFSNYRTILMDDYNNNNSNYILVIRIYFDKTIDDMNRSVGHRGSTAVEGG